MKRILSAFSILFMMGILSGCATTGDRASYEGYSMANEGSTASLTAATMVAPIVR